MPKSPLVEVRAHLQRFLLGVDSLPEFQKWFVGWRRRNGENMDALGHDIGLRIAEYTRGDWTEAQLRGKLLGLVEGQSISPTVLVSAEAWQAGLEPFSSSSDEPHTKAIQPAQSG